MDDETRAQWDKIWTCPKCGKKHDSESVSTFDMMPPIYNWRCSKCDTWAGGLTPEGTV